MLPRDAGAPMSSSGYSLRAHLVESLTGIKRPDVPLQVVLRNTAAVIVPMGIGIAMGYPQIGLGVGKRRQRGQREHEKQKAGKARHFEQAPLFRPREA